MDYVLLTGGLGFIGSHICAELINYNIIIIDDLSNSNIDVLSKIKQLTQQEILFFPYSILDIDKLEFIFKEYNIISVIHLAGFKAVGESIKFPMKYYHNNITGTINLLNIMNKYKCKKLIFSSSATVYGDQKYPVNEDSKIGGTTNPYGTTKYMIELMLNDLYMSDKSWSIIILRYFNPIGAHSSGLIGENPNDIPNNLFPYILRVCNTEKILKIFGNDYDTPDGTCIRDFIHVVDLAKGHVKALIKTNSSGIFIYNLGTGKGTSVIELIKKFIEVNNVNVKYEFISRRSGDLPIVYANVEKSSDELGWKSELNIEDMCRDGWKFKCRKSM